MNRTYRLLAIVLELQRRRRDYCHLRQAVRVFRVARIDQVAVLDRTFAPVTAVEDGWGEPGSGQPTLVQLLADPRAARWVREAHQDALLDEETTSGGVHMTLLLPPTADLIRRLLHWGGDVRVLEPAWLQARLLAHAERMLANYSATLGDD
jgi:predicted DNA-binding transcriptional regulator YafY